MSANLHVGDTGTTIVILLKNQDEAAIDLSSFSSIVLLIKRPDNSLVERDCFFVTNGMDGKVQYTTIISDLTIPGNYRFQIRCNIGDSNIWHSNIIIKKVYINVAN